MAPATTTPIKILTDLGYEVWEMETDADMLRALVEAVNSLSVTNPRDGRIPILQDAIKGLRVRRRTAAPSQGQKYSVNRKTLKGSKFIPRSKSKAKATANKVAMLPAAQDDNAPIFSTLLNGLKNIASLLKNIGLLLGAQFVLKKLLATRQRRKDALEAKKKREEGLEGEKSGIGEKIKETIAKPIKSFWDTLLNFFKNIILGSAVLGFYKWMKDPKNLETIKGIGDWFNKYGKAILITLGSLLALDIGFKAYRLVQGIRSIVKALKLGEFFKRPWWKKPLNKTSQKTLTSKGVVEGTEKGILKGVEKLNAIENARLIKEEKLLKAGRNISKVIPKEIVEGGIQGGSNLVGRITAPLIDLADDVASQLDNFLINITQNITKTIDPKRVTSGLLDTGTDLADKVAAEAVEEQMTKLLTKGITDTVAKSPTAFFSKGASKVIPEGGMAGMDIMKLIGDEKALKELLDNGTITKKVYENLIKQGIENPVLGKALSEGVASKLINPEVLEPISKQAMKKLGPWGWFKRSLPLISTGLDTWSAIEELQKGNLQSSLLFAGGAVTSMVAPWWSFGLSMAGVAESIRADRAKESNPNYEDPLGKYLKNIEFAPHMVTPQLMDFYSLSPMNKKKNVNIVLEPTDTGESSNSGSGATSSDVEVVSSVDVGNNNVFQNKQTAGVL